MRTGASPRHPSKDVEGRGALVQQQHQYTGQTATEPDVVPVKPLRVWTRRAPPILFARHLAAAQPGPRNQPAASWPWVSPSARAPRHRAPAAEPWRRAGGQWQERFPAATAYACPGLKAKEPRVFGGAAELGGAAPPQWQSDVEPLWLSYEANPFTGQPFFNEARALRPALRPYQQ